MKKKPPKKLIFFILAIIFLIFFGFFTFVVKSKILNQFDFDTTVLIQNQVPKKFDTALSVFSLLGSFEILMIFLFGIFFLLKKKLFALITFFSFVSAHLFEIVGKTLLNHPGPPFQFFRYNLPFLFPSSYVQTGASYPSGHSLRTVFVAMIAFFVVVASKKIKPEVKLLLNFLLFLFTLLMLFSRVSLGEHWSTDVIGGTLLGLTFGLISLVFL